MKGKKRGRVRESQKRGTWTRPENRGLHDGVKKEQKGSLTKKPAYGRNKRGKPCYQVTTTPTKVQNLVSGGAL
jgi:hypothetical protein